MKRSKGQDQGRTPQFGSRKVQTTVRIPEHVLEFLKDHYGIFQRAIDTMLIVPILREMMKQENRDAAKAADPTLREAAARLTHDRKVALDALTEQIELTQKDWDTLKATFGTEDDRPMTTCPICKTKVKPRMFCECCGETWTQPYWKWLKTKLNVKGNDADDA